jgi:hypothetical protein
MNSLSVRVPLFPLSQEVDTRLGRDIAVNRLTPATYPTNGPEGWLAAPETALDGARAQAQFQPTRNPRMPCALQTGSAI